MTRLPIGKTRLDVVREAAQSPSIQNDTLTTKRGRMVLSIDRLVEDPANERKTFRAMEGLIDSIKAVGLVEPITVSGDTDGKLRIVTGHRRYRAAKAAGLTQVEVIIRDPEDERTRRVKSIVSNVQREDVGPVELAEALQSLLDDGHFATQAQLASAIGKRKQWLSDRFAVLTLSTDLLSKVRSSNVPIGYEAMTRIARLNDRVQQNEFIDLMLSGATGRDVRKQIDPKSSTLSVGAGARPKPKRVFHTDHKVVVIIQSEDAELPHARVTAGLREALDEAIAFLP